MLGKDLSVRIASNKQGEKTMTDTKLFGTDKEVTELKHRVSTHKMTANVWFAIVASLKLLYPLPFSKFLTSTEEDGFICHILGLSKLTAVKWRLRYNQGRPVSLSEYTVEMINYRLVNMSPFAVEPEAPEVPEESEASDNKGTQPEVVRDPLLIIELDKSRNLRRFTSKRIRQVEGEIARMIDKDINEVTKEDVATAFDAKRWVVEAWYRKSKATDTPPCVIVWNTWKHYVAYCKEHAVDVDQTRTIQPELPIHGENEIQSVSVVNVESVSWWNEQTPETIERAKLCIEIVGLQELLSEKLEDIKEIDESLSKLTRILANSPTRRLAEVEEEAPQLFT